MPFKYLICEKYILGVFQNIHDSFDEIDSSGLVPYTVQSENGRETLKGFHKPLGYTSYPALI